MSNNKTFNLFGNWATPSEDKTGAILESQVLSQESVDGNLVDSLETARKDAPKQDVNVWSNFVSMMKGGKDNIDSLIEVAKQFNSSELSDSPPEITVDEIRRELKALEGQLTKNFSGIDFKKVDPLAAAYYLEKEDSLKNPSWKRRKHRFLPGLQMETVDALHDALYLAELAYVDTVDDVQKGIDMYKGERYELVFCTVEGKPREPAHYLCIKKEAKSEPNVVLPWSDSFLEVLLVVRGTKEIADIVSDAMLESREYRQGKAHDGLYQSGKYLVNKHLPLLNHVLEKSQRKRIKLFLVGHSLGAAAAAIACIEFNDIPKIEATCIGFGCPALISKQLSEKWKDKIITIVADADCVPRMSGATLFNLLTDVFEFDWKPFAMEDVTQIVDFLAGVVPFISAEWKVDRIKWVKETLEKSVQPVRGLPRRELELFPPGKCIHLYRDGIGISAVEVPCTFFNELDVTRTMVDDHLIPSGYNRLFLELTRMHKHDSKFQFPNDVMALRAEKNAAT